MGISVKDIVTGRKTFFITPYISLIPEDFLEEYFVNGYECYFVENDKKLPIEIKLDIIISLFKDVILFFNIDYESEEYDWPNIIRRVINKYHNSANIGVMYIKRQSKDFCKQLEQLYLYDMGLNCGCIQLEYQKRRNYDIIETILRANQAQGRRVNIRTICPPTCTFSFEYNHQNYSGQLQDVSLSHFSILLPIDALDIPIAKKLEDVRINLKGTVLKTNAMLMAQREVNHQILYVFAFITSDGNSGLDERIRQNMIPQIYNLMCSNTQNFLNQVYERTKEKLEEAEKEKMCEY